MVSLIPMRVFHFEKKRNNDMLFPSLLEYSLDWLMDNNANDPIM